MRLGDSIRGNSSVDGPRPWLAGTLREPAVEPSHARLPCLAPDRRTPRWAHEPSMARLYKGSQWPQQPTVSTTSRPYPARPIWRRGVPSTRSLPKQVGQDLRAGTVAAPLAHVLVLARHYRRRLLAQAGQQGLAITRRLQHHHHATAFGVDGTQGIGGGHAEIIATPVQQVGQRVFHLHPHQGGVSASGVPRTRAKCRSWAMRSR